MPLKKYTQNNEKRNTNQKKRDKNKREKRKGKQPAQPAPSYYPFPRREGKQPASGLTMGTGTARVLFVCFFFFPQAPTSPSSMPVRSTAGRSSAMKTIFPS